MKRKLHVHETQVLCAADAAVSGGVSVHDVHDIRSRHITYGAFSVHDVHDVHDIDGFSTQPESERFVCGFA